MVNLDQSMVPATGYCSWVSIDNDFFLWNPLTSYFKKVFHYDRDYFRDSRIVSGLCHDSSTDDYIYKVVIVEYTPGFGYENVVVCSFKSKSWTEVDCSSYIISLFNAGPTVNKRLHWYVSKQKKPEYSRIVYFNTQTGTFKKVPMPQPKRSDGDVVYGLRVLDGCLCMSRSENPSNGESNNIEVLVMKEYGMANSWTLIFTVSDLRPFGCTRRGKALALKVPPHQESMGIWHVSVHDPIDNSTRDIPIPTRASKVDVIMYEESLVKPTDYNWEDEDLREEGTYVEYYLNGSHAIMKMGRRSYWRRQVQRHEHPTYQDGWSEEEE